MIRNGSLKFGFCTPWWMWLCRESSTRSLRACTCHTSPYLDDGQVHFYICWIYSVHCTARARCGINLCWFVSRSVSHFWTNGKSVILILAHSWKGSLHDWLKWHAQSLCLAFARNETPMIVFPSSRSFLSINCLYYEYDTMSIIMALAFYDMTLTSRQKNWTCAHLHGPWFEIPSEHLSDSPRLNMIPRPNLYILSKGKFDIICVCYWQKDDIAKPISF